MDPVSGWWFIAITVFGCAAILGMEWLEKLLFDSLLRPKGKDYASGSKLDRPQ